MMIKTISILALLLSPLPVGAASYGLRQVAPLPSMVGRAARNLGRPRFASISGKLDGKAFSMRLSRSLWVLSGEIGEDAIGVKIDHDGKSMLGDVGGRRVELAFHWTPAQSLVQGTYNGSPIRYNVDFREISAVGAAAGKPFRVSLDRQTRKVTGGIDGRAVSMDYNPMSGRLHGKLAGRPIDVTLSNLELGEFLQYFFILLP